MASFVGSDKGMFKAGYRVCITKQIWAMFLEPLVITLLTSSNICYKSHNLCFSVYLIFQFLSSVESADQCLLNSKVLSCFSGVIMSIRSFFLLLLSSSLVMSLRNKKVSEVWNLSVTSRFFMYEDQRSDWKRSLDPKLKNLISYHPAS